jgi:hypothetical protein
MKKSFFNPFFATTLSAVAVSAEADVWSPYSFNHSIATTVWSLYSFNHSIATTVWSQ